MSQFLIPVAPWDTSVVSSLNLRTEAEGTALDEWNVSKKNGSNKEKLGSALFITLMLRSATGHVFFGPLHFALLL